jgi:hypothetical protein
MLDLIEADLLAHRQSLDDRLQVVLNAKLDSLHSLGTIREANRLGQCITRVMALEDLAKQAEVSPAYAINYIHRHSAGRVALKVHSDIVYLSWENL